jgi:hypothetical protein
VRRVQIKADVWKSSPLSVKVEPGQTVRVLYTPALLAWQSTLTAAE